MKMRRASLFVSALGVSALLVSGLLTGCGPSGSSSGGNSNKNQSVLSTKEYSIALNAENSMCNGALMLTVTGIQRRPVSTFAGYKIKGSSTGQAEEMSTDDVVVEVDISYTWNVNKYVQSVTAAGGKVNSEPKKLEDLLKPGDFMIVRGTDAYGGDYLTYNYIVPDEEKDVNGLGINSQWDYDLLGSALPEPSKTKEGSILFVVSSTAENLKLCINTPASGQEIASGKGKLESGQASQFSLDLT